MTITTAIVCKECNNITGNNITKIKELTYWHNMLSNPPSDDGEILFISKDGITEDRIGTALAKSRIIVLSKTDITFDDVLYWIPIPKNPH